MFYSKRFIKKLYVTENAIFVVLFHHLLLLFWQFQELRSKREQELATLKKSLEDDTQTHEVQMSDVRHKHTQEIAAINEQLENIKKGKVDRKSVV